MWIALGAVITSALATLLGRVILAAGVGVGVYTVGVPALQGFVESNLLGAPDWFLDVASIMQLDVAITIIFSALAVRTVTRLVSKGGE